MIDIPEQLQEWRFILVKSRDKVAFERDWPTTANYAWNDPKLQAHLQGGGNYGVLCGPDHVVVETDSAELERLVEEQLPPTFTQRSPGHKHKHFFYHGASRIIPILDKTLPAKDQNIGHVKSGNSYVLGPGSTHPNGGKYEAVDADPVAKITEEQILNVIAPFRAELSGKAETAEGKAAGADIEFPISAVARNLGLKRRGDELYGAHPVHGSTTGANIHVNLAKQVWHCFRCNSGGGPLSLFAVLERIIECEDAVPGGLRGDTFKKTYSRAIAQGLVKPVSQTKQIEWNPSPNQIADLSKPLTFKEVADILGITVKRDTISKIVLFSSNLLTYTEEEQVNVLMAAEASTGKSYLPIEISMYFPEADVIILGGASPTSFFHEVSGGELALWDPDKKQSLVHLENKILIFLDQPHAQLLEKLRPLLSHDMKRIKYKISDRSQKAGLRTKTIILNGYPCVEFCTANFNLDQQERTRLYMLSPETGPDKVLDALELLLRKKSDREAFKAKYLADPGRKALSERVLDIKATGIRDVVIPEPLQAQILAKWKERHTRHIPRHIRDFDRFLSLVKARALLNWRIREAAREKRIIAVEGDVNEAFEIYAELAESNELGLAPQAYEIFKEVIQPIGTARLSEPETVVVGVSRREIQQEYRRVYGRPLPDTRLRKEIIPPLDAAGLIVEETDPDRKNRLLVYPQIAATYSVARGTVLKSPTQGGREVGVNESLENPSLLHPEVARNKDPHLVEKDSERTGRLTK